MSGEDLPLGAHLVSPRLGYTHHGIYVGAGRVVHYSGLCRSLPRGRVLEVSLAEFAHGHEIAVKPAMLARYCAAEVVARVRSRVGENRYRLASNNCEHLCEWSLRGEARSEQIEKIRIRCRAAVIAARTQLKRLLRSAAGASAGNCAA